MVHDWGKYINGEVFIEDPIVLNNGDIIPTEDIENKEGFNIKEIKYEDFPGIEEGYWFSNYWEETPEYIIQKWKKEKIQTGPSGKLKVIQNQFENAVYEILQMIDLLKKENKKILHSGDLWIDFSDFPKIALEEHFDLCLLEATHYKPAVAAEILKDAKFDRLIFVHVFDKWHIRVYDGWKTDNGEKDLLDYYKSLPYPVSVSNDGDEFLL